jgi:hypothetical protein
VVFIGVGVFVLLAAIGTDMLVSGTGGLPLYCLALTFLAVLLWWELTGTGRAADAILPRWVSPPAMICAWTLVCVYVPATMAFFDARLIDDQVATYGGEVLLVTGALLASAGVTAFSLFYHFASRFLRRRAPVNAERSAPLVRVVSLYVLSAAARTLRLSVVGVAIDQDLTRWGSLQWADQWIGCIEDLRYLALALLVAHILRHGSGYGWLFAALLVEAVFGATSGFLKPLIWPVVLCAVASAALDRIRGKHVAVMVAVTVGVALFSPVVTAIRENRAGALGSGGTDGTTSALATVRTRSAADALESAYLKFFGRQSEVATATGLIMALTPDVVPYEGAARFLGLPANLIPRAIWPDKPVLSRGRWFSANFRGLEESTTSSSAMTLFGESYLFFGWTGLVIGMCIAGTALAGLHRFLDRPGTAVVYLALVPMLLDIEPELSSYLTTIVQRSVVFVIAFVLLTHRAKAV